MGTMSFNDYKRRFMSYFYEHTTGKQVIYKGEPCAKFEAFATLYSRYAKGNSVKEIDLVLDGMSNDFSIIPRN